MSEAPMSEAEQLVSDVSGLVTLPHIYFQINQLVEDPNSSIDDIVQVINQDPVFTLRLLRVANSPLYTFSSRVDTVSRALQIIGTAQVRNLALSMSVCSSFSGLLNDLVSMENFWQHNLLCGLAARFLAREAGRRMDPDALFTAGLLHDIGELILFHRRPEAMRAVLLQAMDTLEPQPIWQIERARLGFDHAEVGRALAATWRLPGLLGACIGYHHDITHTPEYPREVAVIHLANVVAQMAELDTRRLDDVEPLDPLAWEQAGLPETLLEPAIAAIQGELGLARALFYEAA